MQTDTVVGIVGAVVLVSVMVGVFTYEYNNSDGGDGGDGDGASMASFNETYPGLSATDDLDGDGVANHADDDLDGDGVANADDADVVVSSQFSGSVAQSTSSAQSDEQTLSLGAGATTVTLTLTYERPAPLPGQLGQQPSLDFQLTDPNGVSDYAMTEDFGAAGGSTVTVTFEFGGDLPAGDWALTASSNNAVAPAFDYSGDLVVAYSTE